MKCVLYNVIKRIKSSKKYFDIFSKNMNKINPDRVDSLILCFGFCLFRYVRVRNFKVVGRSQLLLATGTRTPSCIANRRQETAPTSACFNLPNA